MSLLPRLKKKNVILGLHPQYIAESPLMLTVDDALEIIKELGSKFVKVIYDTAQQNITYRNFMDDIRKCGNNLAYVHAETMTVSAGHTTL